MVAFMAKPKVLLIEDSADLQLIFRRSLERISCEVVPCFSGRKALELLNESLPDLILMDLTLNDLTTGEFVDALFEILGDQMVPVIVISGREDLKSWAEQIGAVAALKKPIETQRLVKTVQEVLPQLLGPVSPSL